MHWHPFSARGAVFILIIGATGCAPLSLQKEQVLKEVAAHYHGFYPVEGDPDPARDAGLLRPRFGLPAIVRAGAPFPVEVLMRGGRHDVRAALVEPAVSAAQAVACLQGQATPGCYPLAIAGPDSVPVAAGAALARFSATPVSPPPPGAYDLCLASPVDAPTRAPRAVWLRADDPQALRRVRIVQLSDLHVGKGDEALMMARLRQVLGDVSALHPDLVVITGDLVNWGHSAEQVQEARALLLGLAAPVLAVLGNHDIGFPSAAWSPTRYGTGWTNFARAFHPYLYFTASLGGYDLIGFDSGRSMVSPRVLTLGLAPATIAELRQDLARSHRLGHRGVVLLSHAPSRARLVSGGAPSYPGLFGRMYYGRAEFEGLLLEAAARDQRVLHLAGHTHWSEVFETTTASGAPRLVRSPLSALSPCFRPISGKAAIIVTQAAAHSGVPFKENARGYGFADLLLGDGPPEISFHRYGLGDRPAESCPAGPAS